jgi:hypothetical protein
MTRYHLVRNVEGLWIVDKFTEENVVPAMDVRGCPIDPTRTGGQHLRPELRGQPVFKNVLGPMWGGTDEETGEPIVRYEDQKAYDSLST